MDIMDIETIVITYDKFRILPNFNDDGECDLIVAHCRGGYNTRACAEGFSSNEYVPFELCDIVKNLWFKCKGKSFEQTKTIFNSYSV